MSLKALLGMMTLALSAYAFSGESEKLFEEPQSEDSLTQEDREYIAWAEDIWNSLDRKTGLIEIPEATAVLMVPKNFYYLNSRDAEKVLVEVWGNPPSQATLGMLFPAESTPFDEESWAVTIGYEEGGYVSDEDADDIDYAELLSEMKRQTQEESEHRIAEGYESIELVGWAASPYYDTEAHKLHWAKELKFGGQDLATLNYNIRVLGRKGVLVLNFIADMSQKDVIDANLDTVLELADFDQGASYGDFNPEFDKVAAYGIGALVAGKLAVKTGLIAAALIFLKKFGVIIVVALGAIFKKLWSRRKS